MIVRLEIWNNRIAASVPYQWSGLAKTVPGWRAEWDKSVEPNRFMFWSYPLNIATCRALREAFGLRIEIMPKLWAWANEQNKSEAELEQLRGGAHIDMPYVRTEAHLLWKAMQERPFQITGANFIAKGRRVCLGDEPRLGKTYQTLAALVEHGAERVLISCPKVATNTVWARKISELLGEVAFVAQGDRATREAVMKEFDTTAGPRFLVINNEMLRVKRKYRCPDGKENHVRPGKKNGCQEDHKHKTVYYPEYEQLFSQPWDAIVIDESHNVLAASKHQISDNIPQIRLGAVRLPLAADGMKIASSGTPWRHRLDLAWGTLNWLDPDQFGSYWKFAEQYFGVQVDFWGGHNVGKSPLNQEAFTNALRPYYLARTKAEVAPHLKPVEYAGTPPRGNPNGSVGVYIDMDAKQHRAYQEVEDNGLVHLADGKIMIVNGNLAELTRMKQFADSYGRLDEHNNFTPSLPSSKLEWILEFLDERKDLEGKVVIASQYTKIVDLFTTAIRKAGWEAITITGKDSHRQRDQAQDAFMYGSPRVAVINVFAGGEAIDLSSADEMIFIDEPWTDDKIFQAESRIQNLAKRHQLTIYRLRSAGTIDEIIAAMTAEQRQNLLAGRVATLPQFAAP
jgi:SNF2-related domain/Helicase conserved C-terminal domain